MLRDRSKHRSQYGGMANYQFFNDPAVALNGVMPSYMSKFTTNQYYNSTVGSRPFPYAFTRGTNAMQYNSLGQLVYAPANILRRGNDFTQSPWGSNDQTITPGQDVMASGRTMTLVTCGATNGALLGGTIAALPPANTPIAFQSKLKRTNNDWIRILIYSSANSSNQVRAWVNLATGTIGTTGAIGTATYVGSSIRDLGDGSYLFTLWGYLANNDPICAFAQADANASGNRPTGASFLVGECQVEYYDITSPRSYIDTTGTEYYGQRLDYDPVTGAAMGLRVEEARTNLVPASLNMPTSVMSELGVTRSASPATYLGGWTAVRLTSNGINGSHAAYPASIVPAGSSSLNMQAIIKPISSNTFYQLTGSGNWLQDLNGYANFDLSGAGSITAVGASAGGAFIRHLGNGVYHIGVNVSTSAGPVSGAACIIGIITSGTDARLPNNTSTDIFDFIYGGIFQSVAGYTSVVPTFGTSATRAAEVATEATDTWLDQTKGTLYCDFIRAYVAATSGNSQTFAQISDGTNNNRMVLLSGVGTHASHRFDTVQGGVNQAQPTSTGAATALTVRKMVGAYIASNFRACENGGAVGAVASGTLPGASNRIDIGSALTGAQLNGWIRELRYYADAAASNAQLQALTA